MKIQEIAQKLNPENRVLGIILDQDVEYILQTKLKVTRADLDPQEWQELIALCDAKVVDYLKNDQIFNAIKGEAGSFLLERTFRKCETLAKP